MKNIFVPKITSYQIWLGLLFLSLGVTAANGIDTFVYSGAFQRYFFIDARLLTFIWFAGVLAARYWLGELPTKLSNGLRGVQKFGLPLALMLTISLTILEQANFPNYVFSTLGIHYDQSFFFILLTGGLTIIRQSQAFFLKNWRTIIFCTPMLGFGVILLMKTWPNDYWLLQVNHDDAGVENLQVLSLAITSIFSFSLAHFFHKRGKNVAILFLLIALGAFFVLGEEISWGQRLFAIETPNTLKEINTQGELTIHNISVFQSWLRFAYQGIAGLGLALCCIQGLRWLPTVQRNLPYLFPDHSLLSWFATFFFLDITFGGYFNERWFEVAELTLYSIFAIHFFVLWAKRKRVFLWK